MNPIYVWYLTEYGSAAAKWVGIPIAIFAAFRALAEFRAQREQRIRQLRWNQAKAGKQIADEAFDDSAFNSATKMLDWEQRPYKVLGARVLIKREKVNSALRVTDLDNLDAIDMYIRDCFDEFFSYLGIAEAAIYNTLTTYDDVESRFAYYVKKLAERHTLYKTYMNAYEFEWALRFCRRVPAWESKNDGAP